MKNLSILLLLLLTGCGGGSTNSSTSTPTTPSNPTVTPPPPPTYNRQTVDQPDQYPNLRYVHIIYAVPSDQKDLGRDKNYAIQHSLLSANNWFLHKTNGKTVRLDLNSDNDVDITYWKYNRTNAELLTHTNQIRNTILSDAKKQPWYQKTKLYVIYFEGSHTNECGQATIGVDNVAVLYLKNATDDARFDCARNKLAKNNAEFNYLEGVFLHETMHMLGVKHVFDNAADLMYGGQNKKPYGVVDWNNDDYYLTSGNSYIDIYYSAFLDPQDGNQLPNSMK